MKQLLNPFEKHGEKVLLTLGILFAILGSLLGYLFYARFDGVLDLHFTPEIQLFQPFLDNLINVVVLTALLYPAGRMINAKTRLVDVLGASLIARTPLYLLPLFNIGNFISDATSSVVDPETLEIVGMSPNVIIPILIFAFFTILATVWYLTLLYNGFRVASNAKGTKPVVLFVLAVLLAEIISKYLIFQFI